MDCASGTSAQPVDEVIECLANNADITVVSQQRGEPDLTPEQRAAELRRQLDANAKRFVTRYHLHMNPDQLERLAAHVAPSCCLDDVLPACVAASRRRSALDSGKQLKNRRYEYLKRLIAEGTYFSDYEMRRREPLLYEQMVGRFLTNEEATAALHPTSRNLESDAGGTMSDALFALFDAQMTGARREIERHNEAGQDSAHDRHERGERRTAALHNASNVYQLCAAAGDECSEHDSDSETETPGRAHRREPVLLPDEAEQSRLRAEFVSTMHERFLLGDDGDFVDYAQVDAGDELLCGGGTCGVLMQRDAEDAWFDND